MATLTMIHPTAVISPEAQLAADVEVGPFAVVGAGVRLGAGCRVLAHAILEGDTVAGERNTFGYGSVIGAAPQDFAFDPARDKTGVRIGSGNTFREYTTVHRGTRDGTVTTVGDGCFLMVDSHLGHNCALGDNVVMANGTMCGGHVTIEDRAVIGGGAIFHQHVRIGRCAMVRGGGRFSKDIPPYAVGDTTNTLAGLNAVGLRRAGMDGATRLEIRRAYKLVFHAGLNVTQALEAAARETWGAEARAFFDFIRASKLGVCAARSVHGGEE